MLYTTNKIGFLITPYNKTPSEVICIQIFESYTDMIRVQEKRRKRILVHELMLVQYLRRPHHGWGRRAKKIFQILTCRLAKTNSKFLFRRKILYVEKCLLRHDIGKWKCKEYIIWDENGGILPFDGKRSYSSVYIFHRVSSRRFTCGP